MVNKYTFFCLDFLSPFYCSSPSQSQNILTFSLKIVNHTIGSYVQTSINGKYEYRYFNYTKWDYSCRIYLKRPLQSTESTSIIFFHWETAKHESAIFSIVLVLFVTQTFVEINVLFRRRVEKNVFPFFVSHLMKHLRTRRESSSFTFEIQVPSCDPTWPWYYRW